MSEYKWIRRIEDGIVFYLLTNGKSVLGHIHKGYGRYELDMYLPSGGSTLVGFTRTLSKGKERLLKRYIQEVKPVASEG